MATPLTDYYENLRAALGDQVSAVGTFSYKDAVLAAALRTTVQTGLGPKGVAVASNNTDLDPAPATPDARGYLIFQTALNLVGGNTPFGFKTRAMSVMFDPDERKSTIEHLRRQLKRLETEGDPHGSGRPSCFGIWQEMENALCRTTLPDRLA